MISDFNRKGAKALRLVRKEDNQKLLRFASLRRSFNHIPEITKGVLIADLIAILGSIDIVLGEVDR